MIRHLSRARSSAGTNSREVRGQLIEDLRQVLLCLYPGHDWGQLRGEERSQRRRALGLMSGLALLFLVLAMSVLVFMFDAQRQATIAQRNARESKGRELAPFSTESLSTDPEKSILLGMQAVNATLRFGQLPVPAAEEALHHAIFSSHVRTTLRGHWNSVQGVAFSPDGKRLVTSADWTVRVYALDPRELLNLARSRVTRTFTSEECQRYFQSGTCPPLP